MVDLEIEVVLLRERNLRIAEKSKKVKMLGTARDEGEKGRGGHVDWQQMEKASTWPRTLEETGSSSR